MSNVGPRWKLRMHSVLPDICACDVADKEALAAFRRCRSRWYEWLIGNDDHSISTQITTIVWDDAIFRTINEARRLATQNYSAERGFNTDLIDLLDRGFVTSQVMAIRRLIDSGFHDPRRGVISLARLLNDVETNQALLTREHYICFDGTPYDAPLPERDRAREFTRERMHRTFDRLSGTQPASRSRTDVVQLSVIESVSKSLEACGDLRNYANQFIAHAAEPSARRQRVREQVRITLDALDSAYRAVVRAASFVGLAILFEQSLGEVPQPQYDHLANLDKPMVLPHELDGLHAFWDARVAEMGNWSENVLPQ